MELLRVTLARLLGMMAREMLRKGRRSKVQTMRKSFRLGLYMQSVAVVAVEARCGP